MKNVFNMPIMGAVLTALLSTLCCLPAFLFLFFGVSSGALTYLTQFEFLRIPMALLTVAFFIVSFIKQNKEIRCECSRDKKIKYIIMYALIYCILLFLLTYPEIIPFFME